MGSFILEPGVDYSALERPMDVPRKFAFYTVRAVRYAQQAWGAAEASNPQENGETSTNMNAGMRAVAQSGIQRQSVHDDKVNGQIKCVFTPERTILICQSNLSGDNISSETCLWKPQETLWS